MQARDAYQQFLQATQHMVNMFVGDLSDADLLVRPVSGANHIAWQLGHLIASERDLMAPLLPGASYPELPAALKTESSGKSAKTPPTSGYLKKEQYLEWFNKVRSATVEGVGKLSDADFERPNNGPMKEMAPTVGAMLTLVNSHTMMHAGQFSVVRRALDKPVLF